MNLIKKFLHLPKKYKIATTCFLIILFSFAAYKIASTKPQTVYQTTTVEKGTLMTTVAASGTITSGDTTYITTGATGVVKKVYSKNGDTVSKGQKIAEILLDDIGRETQTTAWNNYQKALVAIKNSQAQKISENITVLEKYNSMVAAENAKRDGHSGGWNPQTKSPYTATELTILDKEYDEAVAAHEAAQTASSISSTNISLAEAQANAAYRNYQKVSSTIYAPVSGILQNLILADGMTIGNSTTSTITVSTGTTSSNNSQTVSSQQIAAIKNPNGQYLATISLTEVDVTTVQSGQKVVLTMDAYPDNTLTGVVLAVNTSGNINSGVTSYIATILLDKTSLNLFTNMAVSATIITNTKTDILLVPSSSTITTDSNTLVQVKKDNQLIDTVVVTGLSNETQTEIVSGLSVGDTIVTAKQTSSTSNANKSSSRSFSSTNLFGGSGMGGGMPGNPNF